MAADGHAQIPHALVRNQEKLDLPDGEFCTLIALLDAWWGIDQLPFMSTATLAKRRNVTQRTIERQLNSLIERGLIKKVQRKGVAARYRFDGLREKLEELARERLISASRQTQGEAATAATAE